MEGSSRRRRRVESRRKYLSFEGILLAPSHVFYIKGSSKMFFMEFRIVKVLHSDWKEPIGGSRLTVIFPLEPSFPRELRFMQNDPQMGRVYSLSHLVKASLSLLSFQDEVYHVFKISSDSHCSLLPSSLNDVSLQPGEESFSYKGIVTEDSLASSGIYVLDKILKLIATNLCVVSNLRLFKKGMTLEIFNGHYQEGGDENFVIFLCGRSFVKATQLAGESSLHSRASVGVYASDPLVDMALDYNLGLKNIQQVLAFKKALFTSLPPDSNPGGLLRDVIKSCLNISEFMPEYRSLVREFFSRWGVSHDSSCVCEIDLFKGDLRAPFPSIKAFKETYLSQFLAAREGKNTTPDSQWSVPWNHVRIEIDPKDKGALIGKLMFDGNTGRYVLRDGSESIPLALMEDEEPTESGYLSLRPNSLVVLCVSNYSLVFESSSNWNKMYILIAEGDLKKSIFGSASHPSNLFVDPNRVDSEWIVLRCSPPTRNNSSSLSSPLEFIIEGKSKDNERTDYLAAPVKEYTSLRPGSKLIHYRGFNDKRKEFYRIYFSNSSKSLLADPRIDAKFYQSCMATHDVCEILPNTPMSGVNIKAIVLRRRLNSSKNKPGKTQEQQSVHILEPTEFAFVNCSSLQLIVVEEDSPGTEHSIYFNNRKNIPYPLGILPGMKVLVTSLEADLTLNNRSRVYFVATPMTCIIPLGFSEVRQEALTPIAHLKRTDSPQSSWNISAFVDKLKKLIVTTFCASCSTALLPGGTCPYPGCHAPAPETYTKLYSLFEVSDESGECISLLCNSKETLQVFLCLDDKEWEDFMGVVRKMGYFKLTHKGYQALPYLQFDEEASDESSVQELKSYTGYFYLLTEFQRLRYSVRCRFFKSQESNKDLYYALNVSPFKFDEMDH